MEIYKFGGASIKDAPSIRRVVNIFQKTTPDKLLIVVSATGKTTNHLEQLLNKAIQSRFELTELYKLSQYHLDIINQLFGDNPRIHREG